MIKQAYDVTMRKMAIPVVKLLAKTKVTPNQLTVFRFLLFMPLATYYFAQGNYFSNLVALCFCLLFSFFDFVDGTLAKLKSRETQMGEWLDTGLDWITQSSLICGITFGTFTLTQKAYWLIVGLVAIFGHSVLGYISREYRYNFGFSEASGSTKFRERFVSSAPAGVVDIFLKNVIELSHPISFIFFSIGLLIALGAIFNQLPLVLLIIAVATNIRWIIMYYLYAQSLREEKNKLLVVELLKELARGE